MDTNGHKAHGLRREMARVRRAVHEDVVEIIESTRTVLDWRHYVRKFPGVASLAAATLGYLLVPHKRQPPTTEAQGTQALEEFVPGRPIEQPAKARAFQPRAVASAARQSGLMRLGFGLLKSVLMRQAVAIATRQIEKWIESASNPRTSDLEPSEQAPNEYSQRMM